jgi:endoglucanase
MPKCPLVGLPDAAEGGAVVIRFLRRTGHALAAILIAGITVPQPCVAQGEAWEAFVQRHVTADGRVVDDGAGGISHSEGQGIAMLLATHHGDRPTFDRLRAWTLKSLAVRGDGLLAWRWQPGQGLSDFNNATDGDLFVAWALARAARRWEQGSYRAESAALARAIRERLVRDTRWGRVLLPGATGFERVDHSIVNLSYWVFPAFADLNTVDPSELWGDLARAGLRLIDLARFGRWQLPPDWLRLTDPLAPSKEHPPRFGYDAARIPLYLMWAGHDDNSRMAPYRAYWSHFEGARFLPAWTDLSNDSIDSHDAIAGIRAIAAAAQGTVPAGTSDRTAPIPYYSAALVLLVQMMRSERSSR